LRGLRRAYEACDDESGFRDYLNSLQATHPSTSTMLALAEQKRDREGVLSAGLFITEALKVRPSVKGFNRLIDMHLEYGSSSARESLMSLRSLTQQLEISKPIYRCGQCGFSGRNLVWQCPSCRRWGSIRPIFGLEGE
jgi:lipopolysaccharide biosynthesis regulator YciM